MECKNILMIALVVFSGVPALCEQSPSSLLPAPRKAEKKSEQKPSIGILAGIADPQNGQHTTGSYGLDFAYQPYIPISTGLEVSGNVFAASGGLPGVTRTKLLAKMAYNFGGATPVVRYSYAGFGLGPVFDNISNSIDTELGFAPMLGFDIPLASESVSHFSLGANANYLFVGGAKPEVFAINGVAKYWF